MVLKVRVNLVNIRNKNVYVRLLLVSVALSCILLPGCSYQGKTTAPLTGKEALESVTKEKSPSSKIDEKEIARAERFEVEIFAGFDTVTRIIAYEENKESFDETIAFISERLEYYHKLFTSFEEFPDLTNVSTLNRLASGKPIKVEPDLFNLLVLSVQMSEDSGGAFNPVFGSVTSLWKEATVYSLEYPEKAFVPEKEKLLQAQTHTQLSNLILDQENQTVYFLDPEMKLDLGAIAKGYALELLLEEMKLQGNDHYLISIGGNVKTLGPKEDGKAWVVGVQDPFSASGVYAIQEAVDVSLVTSGVYERFYQYGEEIFHHIIDPETLYPSEYYVSVSIVHEDSGIADALSTALFNLPLEEGRKLAEKYSAKVLWIFEDKSYEEYNFTDTGKVVK